MPSQTRRHDLGQAPAVQQTTQAPEAVPARSQDQAPLRADPAGETEAAYDSDLWDSDFQTLAGDVSDEQLQGVPLEERSENKWVLNLLDAVKDVAKYSADYQDEVYRKYLTATHMSPVMGRDVFEALAVSAVASATGSAVKAGIVASLTALGSFAAPIGNVVGFMVGTAVSFIYDCVTDTKMAEIREHASAVLDHYGKVTDEHKDARDQLSFAAERNAKKDGEWDQWYKEDSPAVELAAQAARAEALRLKSAAVSPQVSSLLAVWKRQNVDEVHGGINGENGHSRADVDNEQWTAAGPRIRNERDLFTHQIEGELARAGLSLDVVRAWREEINKWPGWEAKDIAEHFSKSTHDLTEADSTQLKQWIQRVGKSKYYQFGLVCRGYQEAVSDGVYSAEVKFKLEVSEGCVELEESTWTLTFPDAKDRTVHSMGSDGAHARTPWSPLTLITKPHEKYQ